MDGALERETDSPQWGTTLGIGDPTAELFILSERTETGAGLRFCLEESIDGKIGLRELHRYLIHLDRFSKGWPAHSATAYRVPEKEHAVILYVLERFKQVLKLSFANDLRSPKLSRKPTYRRRIQAFWGPFSALMDQLRAGVLKQDKLFEVLDCLRRVIENRVR